MIFGTYRISPCPGPFTTPTGQTLQNRPLHEAPPIYFGSVELPERVDSVRGQEELVAASEMGVIPFTAEAVQGALNRGGNTLQVQDTPNLYLAISDLILIYSPSEVDRAQSYRILPE